MDKFHFDNMSNQKVLKLIALIINQYISYLNY
jgi:hypothetical protein